MTALLKALATATKDDLTAVETRIDELIKELESLRAAQKLLGVRLNGKPTRAPSGTGKAGQKNLTDRATKIFDLVTAEGSLSVATIATHLGETKQAISMTVMRSDWLRKNSRGEVEIVKTGE